MKHRSPILLLLGIVGMASGAGAQVAPEAVSWGEPVAGVQLHLELATALPVLPGDLPALQMQIRNLGSVDVVVRPEALGFAQIEIDGSWYGQDITITGTRAPVVIAPGGQSSSFLIRPPELWIGETGTDRTRRFALLPGPHRIRVRNLTEQGGLNIRTAEGKVLELVSNYIAVNVAALSPSAEREVLDARAAARDVESGSRMNDDPDMTEVQVTVTRIQVPPAIACVSIDNPGVQQSPEHQARMAAEAPEVRHAVEVVDRHLAADLTRGRSMLRLHFRRFEDRGDEIWVIYDVEYPPCTLLAAHNTVTMAYNKKSGEVSGRNP